MTITIHLKCDSHRNVKMAMTPAERQRKRRAKLKLESKKQIFVKGENGEFDERIRVALAVKELVDKGLIPKEIIELIIKTSETVIPTKDNVTKKYINKIISDYLNNKDKEIETFK